VLLRETLLLPSSWFGSNCSIENNHWCQYVPLKHTNPMGMLHFGFVLIKLIQGLVHAWEIKIQLTNCNHYQLRPSSNQCELHKIWCAPKFPIRPKVGLGYSRQRNCEKLGARSQLSTLKGVEGCAKAPGWD